MEESRWQKIDEIFFAAAELYGPAREDYLSNACRDDEAMRSELAALLEEHECPITSLDSPVFDIGLQILDGKAKDKRTGETLGHFKFGKLIGRGGMGEIYAAEDTKLGRRVAIKLVNELFALDPERIRRFRKEAKAASRVDHPNVAKLYELCEINGENLIVMELVDGINLRRHLAQAMPLAKALDIAIQIASALAAAHAVGVVHRDIKPENIIITPSGTVKVLDFGLAKLVEPIGDGAIHIPDSEKNAKLTVDISTELGALIGTPAYMSPEQIRGADIDTLTDIWSFGVLLYEMLSGQMPFRGSTKIDLIAAILISEPAPIQNPQVPYIDDLNSVLLKTLRKEKSERFWTADELLASLTKIKKTFDSSAEIYLTAGSIETQVTANKGQTAVSTDGGIYAEQETREVGNGNRISAISRLLHVPLLQPLRHYAGRNLVKLILGLGVVVLSSSIIVRLAQSYSSPPPSDLVSYWTADGNANDVIGGNDGALRNDATFEPGYDHQAFSLDGVNNYIEVPDSPSLSITGPLTLGAIINLNTNTVPQAIIEKYDEPGINGYLLRLNASGKLEAAICNHISCGGVFATGATTVSTGTWHNVAAAYDGTSMRIYLDGILDANLATGLMPTDGTSSLKIGARGDDANTRFGGLIDEVKIYNRALSPTEISLVSHWPADGNANDIMGNNNGHLSGGAAYRQGVSGQAFSYDGTDDFMEASTNGLPTGISNRTLAMWVVIDDYQTSTAYFGGYGGFGTEGKVYFLGTLDGKYLSITNWGEGPGITPLDPGKWYHIAATTDQNSTSLYVDGNLVKTQNLVLDTPADTHFFSGTIPGELGKIRRLKGAVDEIEIYNRALSASEIQTIFLARTPPVE